MSNIVALIIPFIALAILSVMIDKFTLFLEGIMHRIPRLPDKFEWWFAYALVVGFGYLVCWQGDFNLFVYLDFRFWYLWEGYLLTALVISGGSTFVRTQFTMINDIPSAVWGASSTASKFLRRNYMSKNEYDNVQKKKAEKNKNEESYPEATEATDEVTTSSTNSSSYGYNSSAGTAIATEENNNAISSEIASTVTNYNDTTRYTSI